MPLPSGRASSHERRTADDRGGVSSGEGCSCFFCCVYAYAGLLVFPGFGFGSFGSKEFLFGFCSSSAKR